MRTIEYPFKATLKGVIPFGVAGHLKLPSFQGAALCYRCTLFSPFFSFSSLKPFAEEGGQPQQGVEVQGM